MAVRHIIIVGGVSVNNTTHDANPFNFINPGVRRAKALKTNVAVIIYTPGYELRVAGQKAEHKAVENPKKDKQYFFKVVQKAAADNGFTALEIRSAAGLTPLLLNYTGIATIDYFGHSDSKFAFLEYSSISNGASSDYWGEVEAAAVKPSRFAAGAVFASYGCNQGDSLGLAEKFRALWRVRTIGSRGKTNFDVTGPFGGPTFPTSRGGYVAYPAPVLDAKGQVVLPLPAVKTLTYSASSPPS